MKDWKHTIQLGTLHKQYRNEEITIVELAKELSKQLDILRKEHFKDDDDLQDYVWWLEDEDEIDLDSYNEILASIYDWADDNSVWLDPTY